MKKTIGLWILALFVTSLTVASYAELFFGKKELGSSGVITLCLAPDVDFNVYADKWGNQRLENILWPVFEMYYDMWDVNYSMTFWIRNEGSIPIYLAAGMNRSTFVPSYAVDYFHLTFDFQEERGPLEPNRQREWTITLTIDKDVTSVTNFSFDIVIGARDIPW